MKYIRGLFRLLWRLAQFVWPFTGSGQMFRGAATLWTFLFFLFFGGFAVAWLVGFSPSEMTAWLDTHAALWNSIGGWLWRAFWGLVLLVCAVLVFGVGMDFFGKRAEEFEGTPRNIKGGCCALIAILVTVYVGWIAITMPI